MSEPQKFYIGPAPLENFDELKIGDVLQNVSTGKAGMVQAIYRTQDGSKRVVLVRTDIAANPLEWALVGRVEQL